MFILPDDCFFETLDIAKGFKKIDLKYIKIIEWF